MSRRQGGRNDNGADRTSRSTPFRLLSGMRGPVDQENGQPPSPGEKAGGCCGRGAATLSSELTDGELSKSNMSSKSFALASLAVRLGSEKRLSRRARKEVCEFTTWET